LDGLVNNAGVASSGDIDSLRLTDARRVFQPDEEKCTHTV
jgi:NADP-dependent 3-hydroxy acid dehydrogenase YdfG